MTEVTRIACPGCRSLLRFEPEALDFPANCGGCDCRFSVDIYLRIACPKCHNGSKIRERHRAQRVRCGRCQHHFVANEGIPAGAGGRLLVAKMLDTDKPNPPETIQPFVGHGREEMDRAAATLDPQRVLEAERLKAEAIAERDKMAEETGLFKALLSRLVVTPTGAWAGDTAKSGVFTLTPEMLRELESPNLLAVPAEANPRPSLAAVPPPIAAQPDQDDLLDWQIAEERSRFENKIRELQEDLDLTRGEIEKHRSALAEHRATSAELVAEERLRTEQKVAGLRAEIDRARAEAEENRKRLDIEVPRAQLAAESASERAREVELKLTEALLSQQEAERKSARLSYEHARAIEKAEQERSALSITIERLTQAVLSARTGEYEAIDRLEAYANGIEAADSELIAEVTATRQQNAELGQLADDLRAEIETLRFNLASNSDSGNADQAELQRQFAEERQAFVAELERARLEAQEIEGQAAEQLAGARERLEAATAQIQHWRTATLESQAQHQKEVTLLDAAFNKREQARLALQEENKKLTEQAETLLAENRRLVAEAANGTEARPKPTGQGKKSDETEMLYLDNVRLGRELERAKVESERRLKGLSAEMQRIKVEYEKVVAANERLSERVQQLLDEKLALAQSMGSKAVGKSSSRSGDGTGSREHLVTMAFADEPVEAKNGTGSHGH